MSGRLSPKQGSFLFRLTLRKFWEHPNPPTVRQASDLISACLEGLERGPASVEFGTAVDKIRVWYPDFDPKDLQNRMFRRKRYGKRPGPEPDRTAERKAEPAPRPEPRPEPEPEPEPPKAEPKTEPKAAPKPKGKAADNGNGSLAGRMEALISAGIRQVFVVGPAGCGKTTCALQTADSLDREAVLIPCSLGTPAYTFTGRRHPISGAYEPTEYVEAYRQGKVIVLDEVDKLDPSTAAAVNASLANGHVATPDGPIPRHEETVIIATANTWGTGADRQYCGSNQLDAATLDRFAGGRLFADYSAEYEEQFDAEVVSYCRRVREHIKARNLRRVCSTRMVIAGQALKAAGLDWKGQVTADWSESERAGL